MPTRDTKNKNLNKAKVAKKDEFYTQLPDIERELAHSREKEAGFMKKEFTLDYWIDDGWYVGRLREAPDVFSQGKTFE